MTKEHKLRVEPLLTNIRWSTLSNNFEDMWLWLWLWYSGLRGKTKYVLRLSWYTEIGFESGGLEGIRGHRVDVGACSAISL